MPRTCTLQHLVTCRCCLSAASPTSRRSFPPRRWRSRTCRNRFAARMSLRGRNGWYKMRANVVIIITRWNIMWCGRLRWLIDAEIHQVLYEVQHIYYSSIWQRLPYIYTNKRQHIHTQKKCLNIIIYWHGQKAACGCTLTTFTILL